MIIFKVFLHSRLMLLSFRVEFIDFCIGTYTNKNRSDYKNINTMNIIQLTVTNLISSIVCILLPFLFVVEFSMTISKQIC